MKINCGSCQTQYRVTDEKIPAGGAKLICPKCGHDILIPSRQGDGSSSVNLMGSPPVDYSQTMSYDFQEIDQSKSAVKDLLREASLEKPHLKEGKRYFLAALPGGDVYPVDKPVVTLGRSAADADIAINDSEVSRNHCQVKIFDEHLFLVDLESTNGTFVGGKKVLTARLNLGDTFTIGNTTLAVNAKE